MQYDIKKHIPILFIFISVNDKTSITDQSILEECVIKIQDEISDEEIDNSKLA